jgi:hypothetical protein
MATKNAPILSLLAFSCFANASAVERLDSGSAWPIANRRLANEIEEMAVALFEAFSITRTSLAAPGQTC